MAKTELGNSCINVITKNAARLKPVHPYHDQIKFRKQNIDAFATSRYCAVEESQWTEMLFLRCRESLLARLLTLCLRGSTNTSIRPRENEGCELNNNGSMQASQTFNDWYAKPT